MNSILIILLTLMFSAFFSGMEIAFISSNKLRIELDKKQGLVYGKILSLFARKPGMYIVTMLIGNNIALVIYGITMAILLEPLIRNFISSETGIMVTQILVSTLLILVTGEFLPKTLFRINPNLSLNIFALPLLLIYIVFYPVSIFTIGLSRFILKYLFRVKGKLDRPEIVFGKIDLDHLVSESQTLPESEENIRQDIRIFQNALDFADVKVRECMIPRTEIIAVEEKTGLKTLVKTFTETGLSKILVYKESPDDIIGYINVKDLLKNPKSFRSRINTISIVPETMPANRLLELLMKEKKSIALVVDEFGGTSGLVTVEDILEEIFGEIEDEHDYIQLVEKKISDAEFILSGRLEIDYLNSKYHLNIPEQDDYETIAGFILFHYESIPALNETIVIPPFEFRVLKVSHTRLELLKLTVLDQRQTK